MDRRSTLRSGGVLKNLQKSREKTKSSNKTAICRVIQVYKVLWKCKSASKPTNDEINKAWSEVSAKMLLNVSECRKLLNNIKKCVQRSVYKAIRECEAKTLKDVRQFVEEQPPTNSSVPEIWKEYPWLAEEFTREILDRKFPMDVTSDVATASKKKKSDKRKRRTNSEGPPAKKVKEITTMENDEMGNEYAVSTLVTTSSAGTLSTQNQMPVTMMDVKADMDEESGRNGTVGPPVDHCQSSCQSSLAIQPMGDSTQATFIAKDVINAVYIDSIGNATLPIAEITWKKISRFMCF